MLVFGNDKTYNESVYARPVEMIVADYTYALRYGIKQFIDPMHKALLDRGELDAARTAFLSCPYLDANLITADEFHSLFADEKSERFSEAVDAAMREFFKNLPKNSFIETLEMNRLRKEWKNEDDKAFLFYRIVKEYQKYGPDFELAFDKAAKKFRDIFCV